MAKYPAASRENRPPAADRHGATEAETSTSTTEEPCELASSPCLINEIDPAYMGLAPEATRPRRSKEATPGDRQA